MILRQSFCFLLLTGVSANLMGMEKSVAKQQRIETEQKKLNKALFDAAQKGDLKQVKKFIKKGANINAFAAYDQEQLTPLHIAVYKGFLEIVHYLVAHGADSKIANGKGVTPLWLAIKGRSAPLAQFLIEQGALVNNGDIEKMLFVSSGYGDNVEMAKLLVGYGGNVNAYSSFYACTPLSRAAAYGHWPLVKFLVEKGAKINAADEAGKTPLHEAVRFLDVGMVTFLLEKGASANASDNRGFTPLSYIAEILKVSKKPWHQERLIKYLLIVRELISKGAKVSEATPDEVMAISDAFKDKPLITALMLEDGDTVKELSKHEENFDKLSELLIYAIAQGRRDIVSYLLEIGVNPREALKVVDTLLLKNHLTKDQRITYRSIQQQLALQLPLVEQIIRRTPLHDYLLKSVHKLPTELAIKINPTFVLLEALRRGEIDLVARALKAGADPNGVNKEGTSALALAALYPDVQKSLHLGSLLLDSKAIPTEELLRELCSLKDAQERSMIVQMILNTAFQGKSTLSPELKKMCKKMRFLY